MDQLFGLLSTYMWEEPLASGRNLDKVSERLKKVQKCLKSLLIKKNLLHNFNEYFSGQLTTAGMIIYSQLRCVLL